MSQIGSIKWCLKKCLEVKNIEGLKSLAGSIEYDISQIHDPDNPNHVNLEDWSQWTSFQKDYQRDRIRELEYWLQKVEAEIERLESG